MTKARIGIVGSGSMAQRHAEEFSKLNSAEIVGVASRNRQTGAQLAQKCGAEFSSDWPNFVQRKDLDAIVITTHNDSHAEIAIAALQSDKHVLTEYPLARSIEQGEYAIRLAKSKGLLLRTSHSESVSNPHKAVKKKVLQLGKVMLAAFWRLTPGRGTRPEVLFNLPVSGPPAHFFTYHIYPIIDLFGPAAWVDGASVYEDLTDNGTYNRFVNTVTVGFSQGGIGQWTWAGGIETKEAEQQYRYILTGGTIENCGGNWSCETRSGTENIRPLNEPKLSLHKLWTRELISGNTSRADTDTAKAFETIRVSLSAEKSMQENRRIVLDRTTILT